jgi:hypothetical protein
MISRDLKSPTAIKIKGALFACIGIICCGIILASQPNLKTAVLLGVAIWAWCRFYYFLFYVLEHYAGQKRPYAGIFDALKSCLFRDRTKD